MPIHLFSRPCAWAEVFIFRVAKRIALWLHKTYDRLRGPSSTGYTFLAAAPVGTMTPRIKTAASGPAARLGLRPRSESCLERSVLLIKLAVTVMVDRSSSCFDTLRVIERSKAGGRGRLPPSDRRSAYPTLPRAAKTLSRAPTGRWVCNRAAHSAAAKQTVKTIQVITLAPRIAAPPSQYTKKAQAGPPLRGNLAGSALAVVDSRAPSLGLAAVFLSLRGSNRGR